MAERTTPPKAPRYPMWLDDLAPAQEKYDLALAIAVDAVEEEPTSAAAVMAAEVIYRGMTD